MPGYRAIVVGAGGISASWFEALRAEKVKVTAVVDLNRAAAEARVREFSLDAEVSEDLKKTLRNTEADFLIDLTIPEAHCPVTCAALKAGLHVIGEKPMATSMAEARKMVRTSEETGKIYMVGQSRRWEPIHEGIRKTLQKGSIGELTTVNCDFFLGAHFGGFRTEMESPLILDMSIHHFDLARMLCGKDPVAVYAKEFNPKGSWYKGDVAANCIFEMEDGVMFSYRGSWCSEGFTTSWHGNWRLIGEKGTLLYENDQPPCGQVVKSTKEFIYPCSDFPVPPSNLKYPRQHGVLREMLQYLRTGKIPQTECHDNIKSLAMVFAAMESSRKGKRIEIRD